MLTYYRLPLVAVVATFCLAAVSGCGEDPRGCETNADCAAGQICSSGQCMFLGGFADAGDDAEVDGNTDSGGFLNPCGGTTTLDVAPNGRCGPCNLDRYVCDGTDTVVCDGDTICPEIAIVTTLPSNVGAEHATLEGRIQALTDPPQTDHGFCFSRTPNPDHDDTCHSLGLVSETGEFSFTVETLRPGRRYYVRAFSTDTQGGHTYVNEVSFTTLAPSLAQIEVTSDSPEHVRISWEALENSPRYIVLRDGEELANQTGLRFDDARASPGSFGPPTDLVATGLTNGVSLQWSASTSSPGAMHGYTVIARYPDADSAPSPLVEGRRASPPVQNYQVRVSGGAWQTVATTSFSDASAPAPSIVAGSARATLEEATILLEATGVGTEPGADVDYEVRAAWSALTSEPVSIRGARIAGPLAYQWQRSTSETSDAFEDLEGAQQPSSSVPAHSAGTLRHFRLRLRAPGAEEVIVDAGSIIGEALPTVTTSAPTQVTTSGAILQGNISAPGYPLPSAHGFCWSTISTPNHAMEQDGDALCSDLGPVIETGAFSLTISNLSAGTRYYVRAFATNTLGTVYQGSTSFVTTAEAPQNVSAEAREDGSGVLITWDPVPGALRYNVFRDDSLIASNISATSYDDQSAPVGQAFAVTPTATTNRTTDVRVEWNTPDVGPGPLLTYHVVAVNNAGVGEPSQSATAQIMSAPITGYELEIDGGPWQPVGDTTSFTHQQAPRATITLSSAPTASMGTHLDYVRLSYAASDVAVGDAPEASYRVRGLTRSGPGAEGAAAIGRRVVGAPAYQWQRAASLDGVYTSLSGAISLTHDDGTAPEGTAYFYRLEVRAPGANSATTTSVTGARARGASILLDEPSLSSPEELIFFASIETLGDPPIVTLGFCWGLMDAPSLTNGADCAPSGLEPVAGMFIEHLVSEPNLMPSTVYSVRAFGEGPAGVSYSEPGQFLAP